MNRRIWHKEVDMNVEKIDHMSMTSNIDCWKLKERERW